MSAPRLLVLLILLSDAATAVAAGSSTRVSIAGGRWQINGAVTYPGTPAEGLLMNVRMVNAAFEDRAKHPKFDPDANTDRFIARIPDYRAQGVRAFTVCLQGGMPGYEGALNSAFEPDGALRPEYLKRVRRIIDACDRNGMVVILGCYYQRQSKVMRDEAAVRAGVVNVVNWLHDSGMKNVMLEIANEYPHPGFADPVIRSPEGIAGLIRLARKTWPELLVSASGIGDGKLDDAVAEASDFLLVHFNSTPVAAIPARLEALKKFRKPIVCNEDDKSGVNAARAAEACVSHGASYGLMLEKRNQHYPFAFNGPADDPVFYSRLNALTTRSPREKPASQASPSSIYFPPPESQGGWRMLDKPDDIRTLGGMDPAKLDDLKQWLLASDRRNFAAVVIRHGYICLQVERGNIEHWQFQYYSGPGPGERHPSHGLGIPARDLARIAYCMLHNGRWNDHQVIPRWFVEQTGGSSHNVHTPELRWKLNSQSFVLGWERPSLLTSEGGRRPIRRLRPQPRPGHHPANRLQRRMAVRRVSPPCLRGSHCITGGVMRHSRVPSVCPIQVSTVRLSPDGSREGCE